MGRHIWRVLLFLLMAFLLSGTAGAVEYDGYIIRIQTDLVLLSDSETVPAGVEEVYAPENLYKTDDLSLIQELEAEGLLVYAEPDYLVTLEDVPDDPYYENGSQWSLSMLDMDEIWQQGLTGVGVRVGVIDSGIYAGHEDFSGTAIIPGVNYCVAEDSGLRTDTSDDIGHGTFVSGVIAAAANNGIGIAGVAPGVEIVPLKCFAEKKTSSVSTLVAGIYGAVDDYDCQILNMSWGLSSNSQTLREAVEYAADAGVIMIAAVGNLTGGKTSIGNDPLVYPAAYDQVIGVGAVDGERMIASFSYQNESVFVTAPGKLLVGLSTSGTSDYTTGDGTSYAVPHVTAAAALARSVCPDLTRGELAALLRGTAEDLGEPGYDTVYGYGLLQIGALLEALQGKLEEVTFYVEESGVSISAGRGCFQPGEEIAVAAAAYGESGILMGAAVARITADQNGFAELCKLQVSIDGPAADVSAVKLFFMDPDTMQPLCGPSAAAGDSGQ